MISGFVKIFMREMRRIFTMQDLLLMCFVAPLLYGIVLSSIYYERRLSELPVGVVDRDATRMSRTMTRYVDATENMTVVKHYPDEASAIRATILGTIHGFIYIPRGFSTDIKKGGDASALLSVSAANFLTANPVMLAMNEVTATVSSYATLTTLRKKGATIDKAMAVVQPLSLDTHILYNPWLDYSAFMIPGMLLVVLQQVILMGLGYSVAEEREKRRERKLYATSGRHAGALLLGKVLPYVCVNLCTGAMFLFVLMPFFGIPAAGHWLMELLYMAFFIFAITSFGMMITLWFRSVVMALIALMFYSMPAFLISGMQWPMYAMPLPLKMIGLLFPSTYFLNDFRRIALGAASFSGITSSLIILACITAVSLTVTYVLLKKYFRSN
jgi:ABC-2 type transport system permease protein